MGSYRMPKRLWKLRQERLCRNGFNGNRLDLRVGGSKRLFEKPGYVKYTADTSDTVHKILHFALSTLFDGCTGKVLGVMKIEVQEEIKYILSISGNRTSLDGSPSSLLEIFAQKWKAWMQKLKKFNTDLSIDCGLAQLYDNYCLNGVPTADKVSRELKDLVAEKLMLFENDVKKALDKGVTPEQISDHHQMASRPNPELVVHFLNLFKNKNMQSFEDLTLTGVHPEAVKQWATNLFKLLRVVNRPLSLILSNSWSDASEGFPDAVFEYMTSSNGFWVEATVTQALRWMFGANRRVNGSSEHQWSVFLGIYDKEKVPDTISITSQLQSSFHVVTFFLRSCWKSNGLSELYVATRFLHCAECNALEHARNANMLHLARRVSWTSAKIYGKGGKRTLVDEEPCTLCQVNFFAMITHDLNCS